MSGLTIHIEINALAQGIKSFLASGFVFVVAGTRTYDTDSPAILGCVYFYLFYICMCIFRPVLNVLFLKLHGALSFVVINFELCLIKV